jgi:benzoyl-CoA reductase/2-hydroxyglutaryl-CoA dehydratase subunit BcrC/BadD/HgdB
MGAFDYFRNVLETGRQAAEPTGDSRPVVGFFCGFVPQELILAAGARPVRLDAGDHGAAEVAESIMPRDACPVARSAVGLLTERAGIHGLLKLVVIPTVCDAKRKIGATAGLEVPVHVLSLPTSKTGSGAREAWLAEVRRLADALTALTGRRITRQSLREAIAVTNARQQAFRRLLELRKGDPPRLSGAELIAVAAAGFVDEPERYTRAVSDLAEEREHAPSTLPDGPRVLLTGAPIIPPNTRLVSVIEGAGLHIVADDLCSATESFYHPVVPMEWGLREMMIAVAEKALLPCTCPCFSEHADRANRIRGLVAEFRAQGVIYHNLRTCMLFQFETEAVREVARSLSIPMLEVSTDYTAQDVEQLRTRVEAFGEMLRQS